MEPSTLRTPLDAEVQTLLEEPTYRTLPPWHTLSVDGARKLEDTVFGGEPTRPLPMVRDTTISGPATEIPVRLYYGSTDNSLPVLLFFHGGGWTLGTLDSADDICRELASRTNSLVVSVAYRLAPEHPFPAALEDAIAALEWLETVADDIGGDSTRIGVCGSSAGGNLAGALARWDANRKSPTILQQALLYPITNHSFETDSYDEQADGPLLTRKDMRWFWNQYLRHPVDGENPYVSILQGDHVGLPTTTVVTCGHDPLRDEGLAYAQRLGESGVSVRSQHHPSLPHGALSLADSVSIADQAMDDLTAAVRANWGLE
ncbi:alpha/beta hydrolase [Natrialbaceae archaeon A-CW2]